MRSPLDRVRSPFPGMDPYLEARWPDLHVSVNVYLAEAVQRSLPPALRSRVVEQLMVLDDGRAAADTFVAIVDTTEHFRLVTVVELLRAEHKVPGPYHDAYLDRLRRHAADGVNVVEVDLLRSPRIGMAVARSALSATHRTPYLICTHRGTDDPALWACYPVPLRRRIVPVPLPLRPGDPRRHPRPPAAATAGLRRRPARRRRLHDGARAAAARGRPTVGPRAAAARPPTAVSGGILPTHGPRSVQPLPRHGPVP